jgi:hypothetical protein
MICRHRCNPYSAGSADFSCQNVALKFISISFMAKVLGEPGRYVSQQSVKRFRRQVLSAIAGIALLTFLFGAFCVYDLVVKKSLLASVFATTVLVLLVFLIGRVVTRKMDEHEKERLNFLKGATGEQAVARKIDDLPDAFCVIHDLATPFGNLDHVVIGPTGVFILETKNWKGTITADGQGDILCNNTRLKQATSKPLIVRMMNVRDKVKTLCDAWQDLPYFSALLVFPSARVEAKWGQTGKARCITDEQIWRCVVETKPERKLNVQEIERLSQAFRALATMDKEFPNGTRPF